MFKLKKALKIICAVASVLILAAIIAIIFLSNYQHNSRLTDIFNEHSNLFIQYIDSVNFEEDEEITEIPDYLEKISVSDIEIADSYVFFEIPVSDFYYSGIYYSANDNYAEALPSHDIEDKEFHIEKDTLYVKGEINNGEDWYMTEKITDNWYYYEFH